MKIYYAIETYPAEVMHTSEWEDYWRNRVEADKACKQRARTSPPGGEVVLYCLQGKGDKAAFVACARRKHEEWIHPEGGISEVATYPTLGKVAAPKRAKPSDSAPPPKAEWDPARGQFRMSDEAFLAEAKRRAALAEEGTQ